MSEPSKPRECNHTTYPEDQPFRAGDTVEVLLGPNLGERWVVACYEARTDTAWIAGWPCTMVTKATEAVMLVESASDAEHAETVERIKALRNDHGERDPRASAVLRILEAGGTP